MICRHYFIFRVGPLLPPILSPLETTAGFESFSLPLPAGLDRDPWQCRISSSIPAADTGPAHVWQGRGSFDILYYACVMRHVPYM